MSNNLKDHKVFLGAILFLFLFLIVFILRQENIVREGEVTILKTRPVDPRDLLRGEHVILSYAIQSDNQIQEFINKSNLQNGEIIYVGLIEDEAGVASVSSVGRIPPKDLDSLYIEGEVTARGVSFSDIEQFFVPEGAGLPIERMRNTINVEVSLRDGEARILRLLDESYVPIDPTNMIEDKNDNNRW